MRHIILGPSTVPLVIWAGSLRAAHTTIRLDTPLTLGSVFDMAINICRLIGLAGLLERKSEYLCSSTNELSHVYAL